MQPRFPGSSWQDSNPLKNAEVQGADPDPSFLCFFLVEGIWSVQLVAAVGRNFTAFRKVRDGLVVLLSARGGKRLRIQ